MKASVKRFAISAFLLLCPFCSGMALRIAVGDFMLSVDTVCHVKIGPGATRTQLHLAGEHPLDVHYITVDLSAPGVKLRAASGSSANGLEKTSAMASRLSAPSSRFFAGINGDFYDVTTTYPDGTIRPRLSTYTSINDGVVRRTSPSGHQFVVDDKGVPYIDLLNFSNATLSCGSLSAAFGGVNVENVNYSGDAASDNAVTLYTSAGWKSTFQTQFAGNCAEVSACLADGEVFSTTSSCKFEVTSVPSSEGNMVVPAGGFVLFGRGAGRDFVNGLKPGDIVSLDNKVTLSDGSAIVPMQSVGGNPPTVLNGVAQLSDGTRPDAVDLHPRTGIGISRDGKSVIMMVIDGRGKSLGATTKMLGDMLVYAGAWEGLNFDGGGSSTCWTASHGVVNTCSDSGGERTVQNSLFAVAEGDTEDTEIAEIRFADWKCNLFSNEEYKPVLYGYNALGMLVNKNVTQFTLSCDPALGTIGDNNTFVAAGSGAGKLVASYGNLTASLPLEITSVKNVPLTADFANWTKTTSNLKVLSSVVAESGCRTEYQMASSVSNASLTFAPNQLLDDECVGLKIAYGSDKALNKIIVGLKANNGSSTVTIDKTDCRKSGDVISIRLKDYFDIADPATWPVKFMRLAVYPSEAAKATGSVTFSGISSVVLDNSGVGEFTVGATDNNLPVEYYNLNGFKVNPHACPSGIYIRRQGARSEKVVINDQ